MAWIDRDTRIHIVEILEATAGGTRTHLLQLLGGLDRKRFRLSLIASCRRNPDFAGDIAVLRRSGVHVVEIPVPRRIAPWDDLVAVLRVASALRELSPDIVHTHSSKAGGLGRIAAWLCGIRHMIHTPHTYYFQGKAGFSRGIYRLIERAVQPLASKIILLSEAQQALARSELGAPAHQTVVIANGVDTVRFSRRDRRADARRSFGLPEDVPVIGAISRFQPQKACDILLRALPKVLEKIPAMRCLLIADGPQRDNCMALARRLGVLDRIVQRDFVSDSRDAYEAMDIFALSSLYEGMPYTILEAMSMSLPVVATQIAGCSDLVQDGMTGLLAEPGNPDDLARCLIEILSDSEKARSMGGQGRRLVEERYTLEHFFARMEALYKAEARR